MLSTTEVFGENYSRTDSNEDKQFPIFQNRINRIKIGEKDSNTDWWLRCPSLYGLTHFCVVYGSGYSYISNAGYSNGVCFGFCINKKKND